MADLASDTVVTVMAMTAIAGISRAAVTSGAATTGGGGNQPRPSSRTASPAPRRLGSRISEYFRERRTPSLPALNAASTASFVPCGVDLAELAAVGISI